MLIWTTRFSRKKAVFSVILMGVVMAVLILLVGKDDTSQPQQQPLAENAHRIAYLESFGWQLNPEPIEILQFLFPEEMDEKYLIYNELQKTQGFDLSSCCGKQISRYTYTVTNYPEKAENVQANLYVCEEQAVAGDIFCPGANGFQSTLKYPHADN